MRAARTDLRNPGLQRRPPDMTTPGSSHILVLALFDEPSGSIRHEVEGVDADGNIRIARIYSDVMTCDMASHYLLLELDRKYDDRPFTLRFTQRLEEA